MPTPCYVAIDIGGTKTIVAAMSAERELLERRRIDTPLTPQEGLSAIAALVSEVAAGRAIRGMGVSAGGPLECRTGVISPLNLPKWRNVPVKAALEDRFGTAVSVDVDTNAAALAEFRFASPECTRLLYVTVSTGVGGGFILDGSIYRGGQGSHPEVGHQAIPARIPRGGSVRCACGAAGCLEAIVSGAAIQKIYGVTADKLSTAQWDEVAYNLGQGLRNMAVIYAPSLIALGGGVTIGGGQRFLEGARAVVQEELKIVPLPEIKVSALGYDTALFGALALAMQAG